MQLASFVGVWSRVQLFEPMLSGSAIDETSLVLWLQAPTGEFVDLRWIGQLGASRDASDWNVRCFKSFAGIGSCYYDEALKDCLFSWHRNIDYRPEGPPDVGRMVFLDEEHNVLLEDGVLPGDDYREIWKRLDGNMRDSFGGRCFLPNSADGQGFFVSSGKYVGVAVRFASSYSEDQGLSLANIFVEGDRCPNAAEQLALDNYFGVIACDGVVVCCSRPKWVGKSVLSTVAHCMPLCDQPPTTRIQLLFHCCLHCLTSSEH